MRSEGRPEVSERPTNSTRTSPGGGRAGPWGSAYWLGSQPTAGWLSGSRFGFGMNYSAPNSPAQGFWDSPQGWERGVEGKCCASVSPSLRGRVSGLVSAPAACPHVPEGQGSQAVGAPRQSIRVFDKLQQSKLGGLQG